VFKKNTNIFVSEKMSSSWQLHLLTTPDVTKNMKKLLLKTLLNFLSDDVITS